MAKYGSVIEALHHQMDILIENGLANETIKVQNAGEALHSIAVACGYTASDADANADYTLADQLDIALSVMTGSTIGANVLTGLAADADIDVSTDLMGKTVTDLQEDVTVNKLDISGTLLYIDDYTDYSEDPEEQEGNYLALHFEVPNVNDVTIKARYEDEKTLESDGLLVIRVSDTNRRLVVTAIKEGYANVVKTYSLTHLTLTQPTEG